MHARTECRRLPALIVTAAMAVAGCSGHGQPSDPGNSSDPAPPTSRVDSVSPAAARASERATLTGTGFGAGAAVDVGGVSAQVVSATGTQIVFEVPSGAKLGVTTVGATSAGQPAGRVPFTVLDGKLLAGSAQSLAVDSTFKLPPIPVDASEVENGVILTRVDVHFLPDATVADVNAALQRVDGGIVSMLPRFPSVTIAIPHPAGRQALAATIAALRGSRGIAWADVGRVAGEKRLPPSPDNPDRLAHLIAARFPAAWNVSALATNGCAAQKVTVLVADAFGGLLIGDETRFVDELPGFVDLGPSHPAALLHGYEVATTAAALFDAAQPTGANPFTGCLTVEGVDVADFTNSQAAALLPSVFPAEKFVLNLSVGYPDRCKHTPGLDDDTCAPDQVGNELVEPVTKAYAAADWTSLTAARRPDFLASVAAGNEAAQPGTAIYPGLGSARFGSPVSVAAIADASLGFVQDAASWAPHAQPGAGGFPSMAATSEELRNLRDYAHGVGSDMLGVADNVLTVGSTTEPGLDDDLVGESEFSDSAPDVMAVGEGVTVLAATGLRAARGTSFTAPQVTGLVSYLWLLGRGVARVRPGFTDLSALPAAVTRRAILANTRRAGLATGAELIDAYAAALSLDAAAPPTPSTAPVRRELLNANTGGASADRFDEADVADFLSHFFVLGSSGAPIEPSARDFSRYDLNGDGFTGGTRAERFDLDRVGSTQFGAADYATATADAEGTPLELDENALTDLDILCYYAYSDLYEGDAVQRRQLLSHLPGDRKCAEVKVGVAPPSVALAPGAQQPFSAAVTGAADRSVTWSLPNGGGTVDASGRFTAGAIAGTFAVRAASVADPSAFAEASVTVTAPQPSFLVQDAYAQADRTLVHGTDVTFPVHVGATGSLGSAASFDAALAGNRITWSGTASSPIPDGSSPEALGHVLLKLIPDRATNFTVTVNSGWLASTPPPGGAGTISAEVETSHGDAVARYTRASDIVLDSRLSATIQAAAGETVLIQFEGVAGGGANGGGDGATVTFESVP